MSVTVPEVRSGPHMPAAELGPFLKRLGFDETRVDCVDVVGAPPGDCTGCQSTHPHPGFAVVNSVFRDDPDDPDSGLSGFDDVLCLVNLASYLRIIESTRAGLEGFYIEIPPDRGGAR